MIRLKIFAGKRRKALEVKEKKPERKNLERNTMMRTEKSEEKPRKQPDRKARVMA